MGNTLQTEGMQAFSKVVHCPVNAEVCKEVVHAITTCKTEFEAADDEKNSIFRGIDGLGAGHRGPGIKGHEGHPALEVK